jgi:predicted transcriptional regulator
MASGGIAGSLIMYRHILRDINLGYCRCSRLLGGSDVTLAALFYILKDMKTKGFVTSIKTGRVQNYKITQKGLDLLNWLEEGEKSGAFEMFAVRNRHN